MIRQPSDLLFRRLPSRRNSFVGLNSLMAPAFRRAHPDGRIEAGGRRRGDLLVLDSPAVFFDANMRLSLNLNLSPSF